LEEGDLDTDKREMGSPIFLLRLVKGGRED